MYINRPLEIEAQSSKRRLRKTCIQNLEERIIIYCSVINNAFDCGTCKVPSEKTRAYVVEKMVLKYISGKVLEYFVDQSK